MWNVKWCAYFLMVALFGVVAPAQALDISEELSQGEAFFYEATRGDKRAIRKAQKQFRAAEAKYPNHPLASAYLGACLALQARFEPRAVKRSQYIEQALVKLDQALGRTSEYENELVLVLKTKLVVANTLVQLPPFFNRLIEGRVIVDELLADEFFAVMSASFRLAAYVTAASYAKKQNQQNDYQRYLGLIVDVAPSSDEGIKARQQLRLASGN